MNHTLFTIPHVDASQTEGAVARLLDRARLAKRLQEEETVLIKPNLVEPLAPPVTTPATIVGAVVHYLKRHAPHCRLVIAEGCGSTDHDTFHCFEKLGYNKVAERNSIELMDLNSQPVVKKENPSCKRWPEMFLPEILDSSFLLSVPVLKAHSLAGVTLTMKNMMGCAPPSHYQNRGSWKKSAFHSNIQEAIFDLNRYRSPDFTLLDATIGMAEAHLWGNHCEPPVGLLVAGYDPVAIDCYGTRLLERNWREVGHIRLADGVLGHADHPAPECITEEEPQPHP